MKIQEVAYNFRLNGPISGNLGKHSDGRYWVAETSEKDGKDAHDFVFSILEFAESFDRIASYRILDAEKPDEVVYALTDAGASAVFAGDEHSADRLVFVCDDLGLSTVALSLGIGTVNTQAILEELHRSNEITADDVFILCGTTRVVELLVCKGKLLRTSSGDLRRTVT